MSQLRILLIGEESAGAQALNVVSRSGHHVIAVMTTPADSAPHNASLATAARRLGYEVWPTRLVKEPDLAHRIRAVGVDLILNVHSRYILDEAILQSARIGAFNLHPGPLPEYAGLNCVSWALYRGRTSYAVTLHWMVPEIDAGDIAYQHVFPIEKQDTPVFLTHKCVKFGVSLILKLIDVASQDPNAIPKERQDMTRREYFGKQIPESGRLSWTRRAGEIVNFVRACDYAPFLSPWGLPRAAWGERELCIAKADRTHEKCDGPPGLVGRCDRSGALIASADEWVSVRQLKIDGVYVKPHSVLKPGLTLQNGV
jgi:methionyl-tRNA formyltransferase